MCTKLYNEDEFQPFDPSQEPIFPPELIVSCFALVSRYYVAHALLYTPETHQALVVKRQGCVHHNGVILR